MSLKSSHSVKVPLNSDAIDHIVIVHNKIHELSFGVNFALSENLIQQNSKTKFKHFLRKQRNHFIIIALFSIVQINSTEPSLIAIIQDCADLAIKL